MALRNTAISLCCLYVNYWQFPTFAFPTPTWKFPISCCIIYLNQFPSILNCLSKKNDRISPFQNLLMNFLLFDFFLNFDYQNYTLLSWLFFVADFAMRCCLITFSKCDWARARKPDGALGVPVASWYSAILPIAHFLNGFSLTLHTFGAN